MWAQQKKRKNRPPGHSPLSSLLTFYDTAV